MRHGAGLGFVENDVEGHAESCVITRVSWRGRKLTQSSEQSCAVHEAYGTPVWNSFSERLYLCNSTLLRGMPCEPRGVFETTWILLTHLQSRPAICWNCVARWSCSLAIWLH